VEGVQMKKLETHIVEIELTEPIYQEDFRHWEVNLVCEGKLVGLSGIGRTAKEATTNAMLKVHIAIEMVKSSECWNFQK
jgi:hypothetical protein